jgi:hypothetical protein
LPERIVIVVPATCTLPAGSNAPTRIERDILERANPFTSSLWQALQ